MGQLLDCGGRLLDLNKPQIMGILNVTPDSFSDGGQLYQDSQLSRDAAVRRAAEMVVEGASIIDIGGESTRPGAEPVSLQQEMDRVLPLVEQISNEVDAIISVDTSSPQLMSEGARLGAGILNDVRALGRPGALEAAAATGLPVCVMHMQGSPATMQNAPSYDDVLEEVADFLQQRIDACEGVGIPRDKLLLDPGFGFGKTLQHNLRLLNNLERFHRLGAPLLIGTSRKSMIGQVLNKEVDQRLYGSLATVAAAVMQGAQVLRVHDVAATADVVRMSAAIRDERFGESE